MHDSYICIWKWVAFRNNCQFNAYKNVNRFSTHLMKPVFVRLITKRPSSVMHHRIPKLGRLDVTGNVTLHNEALGTFKAFVHHVHCIFLCNLIIKLLKVSSDSFFLLVRTVIFCAIWWLIFEMLTMILHVMHRGLSLMHHNVINSNAL